MIHVTQRTFHCICSFPLYLALPDPTHYIFSSNPLTYSNQFIVCVVWSQDNFGIDLAAVEAAAKKHEAIETDILAYEERVQAVVTVSQELEAENYHDIDRINARFVLSTINLFMLIFYYQINYMSG